MSKNLNKNVSKHNNIFNVYGFESIPKYSEEAQRAMFDEYFKTRDPELKNKLIEANVPLAIYCASAFMKKVRSLTIEDLASVGFEHLGEIIDRYDPSLGTFSSFATKSLNGYMLHEMRVMMVDTHLPHYVSIEANEIKRVIKEFEEKNGYTPSSEYISEKTNIDLQKVNDIIGAITVPERFDNLDVSVPDTSKEVFENMDREILLKEMDQCLSDRQKDVLIKRFGLDNKPPRKLREIGEEYNITREGIRQIEKKAIKKLRKHFIAKKISFDEPLPQLFDSVNIFNNEPVNTNATDEYNDTYRDYEGYTEEEFEKSGRSFK